MIACSDFREQFRAGTNDASLLQHLRTCDPCLDFSAHVDPDVMFRALGGDEIVPPGGIDNFVSDVMQAVRVKGTEAAIVPAAPSWTRRLAIAASLALTMSGASIVYQVAHNNAASPAQLASIHRPMAHRQIQLTTKPVVQSYSSSNATILEVPADSPNDTTQVVMIVDESLPADL